MSTYFRFPPNIGFPCNEGPGRFCGVKMESSFRFRIRAASRSCPVVVPRGRSGMISHAPSEWCHPVASLPEGSTRPSPGSGEWERRAGVPPRSPVSAATLGARAANSPGKTSTGRRGAAQTKGTTNKGDVAMFSKWKESSPRWRQRPHRGLPRGRRSGGGFPAARPAGVRRAPGPSPRDRRSPPARD